MSAIASKPSRNACGAMTPERRVACGSLASLKTLAGRFGSGLSIPPCRARRRKLPRRRARRPLFRLLVWSNPDGRQVRVRLPLRSGRLTALRSPRTTTRFPQRAKLRLPHGSDPRFRQPRKLRRPLGHKRCRPRAAKCAAPLGVMMGPVLPVRLRLPPGGPRKFLPAGRHRRRCLSSRPFRINHSRNTTIRPN